MKGGGVEFRSQRGVGVEGAFRAGVSMCTCVLGGLPARDPQ